MLFYSTRPWLPLTAADSNSKIIIHTNRTFRCDTLELLRYTARPSATRSVKHLRVMCVFAIGRTHSSEHVCVLCVCIDIIYVARPICSVVLHVCVCNLTHTRIRTCVCALCLYWYNLSSNKWVCAIAFRTCDCNSMHVMSLGAIGPKIGKHNRTTCLFVLVHIYNFFTASAGKRASHVRVVVLGCS